MAELVLTDTVFLTPRVFEAALAANISGIEPNPAGMEQISRLPNVPAEFLPDVTFLRWHDGKHFSAAWDDTEISRAAASEPYYPAAELAQQSSDMRPRPLGQIRKANIGKKILQVTVRGNWDDLGSNLVEGLTKTGRLGRPKNVSSGLQYAGEALTTAAGFFARLIRTPVPTTSYDNVIVSARDINPYTITYGR